LRKQTYSRFNVTVVYDGPPPRVLHQNGEIFIQGEGSHGPSLRKGLLHCDNELVAIVDDDTFLPAQWLEHAVGAFADPRVAFVGGPNLTPEDTPYLGKLIGHVQSSYFGSFRMASRYNIGEKRLNADETELIATGVYRRKLAIDAYQALGEKIFGSAWENILLTWMSERGYLISYDPELSFFHERRSGLGSFFRQVFKSGSGRARYFKVHPRQSIKKGYMITPACFALYLLSLPLLVLRTSVAVLPLMLYLLVALGVSAAFSVRNHDPKATILLPLLFLTQHLGYGLGFLYGLLGRTVRTWGLE
jgi:cellulose synthase/poly-beta-1,6-N-acetylglucosamine synthase-like glycosyltransferase